MTSHPSDDIVDWFVNDTHTVLHVATLSCKLHCRLVGPTPGLLWAKACPIMCRSNLKRTADEPLTQALQLCMSYSGFFITCSYSDSERHPPTV